MSSRYGSIAARPGHATLAYGEAGRVTTNAPTPARASADWCRHAQAGLETMGSLRYSLPAAGGATRATDARSAAVGGRPAAAPAAYDSTSSDDDDDARPTARVLQPSSSSLLRAGVAGAGARARTGLGNLGNTCYMNSILQCLALPELATFFTSDGLESDLHPSTKRPSLAAAFGGLLRDLWSSPYRSSVTPRAFLTAVGRRAGMKHFANGQQHDSQEFLHALLDGLRTECNRNRTAATYRELQGKGSEEQQAMEAAEYAATFHDSVIDDVFGGQLQSTLSCGVCGTTSHSFDHFVDLSVSIPKRGRTSSIGHEATVEACLDAFTEAETLEGKESWVCPQCKRAVRCEKRLRVYAPPRVLILHLKRFAGARSAFSKDTTYVRVGGAGLDLSPYCSPRAAKRGGLWYDLFAVSLHSGSLHGGHYTALVRNADDGAWYSFNDAHVSAASASEANSPSAYVLFYRRRA